MKNAFRAFLQSAALPVYHQQRKIRPSEITLVNVKLHPTGTARGVHSFKQYSPSDSRHDGRKPSNRMHAAVIRGKHEMVTLLNAASVEITFSLDHAHRVEHSG